MEELTIIALPFVLGLCLCVCLVRWQYRTAEARLRSWAERSQYIVLEQHSANPLGPGLPDLITIDLDRA